MMKEIIKNMKKVYSCEECGMNFSDPKIAKECEDFCKKNKACNTEIIGEALD